MLLNPKTGLRATVREWSIGPAYDPYSATEITLTKPNGDAACYYSDGLGRNRVHLASDHNERSLEWFTGFSSDEGRNARAQELKAQLLARRLMGVTFDDAYYEWVHSDPDPKGWAHARGRP